MVSGALICMMRHILSKFFKQREDNNMSVREAKHLESKARGRVRHRSCGKEFGAAKQEFKEEADIGNILAKYRATGQLSQSLTPRAFGDDVGYKTYADAHEALKVAGEQFLKLPPEIRLELGNDPGRYAELSTKDGVKKVLERMGERERQKIAHAQALIKKHQTPPPSQQGEVDKEAPSTPRVPPETGDRKNK